MKYVKNWQSLFIFLLGLGSAQADSLPENHAVNGGVTIIPIDIKQKPEVYYNNRRIVVTESASPQQWLLVVGVPLDNHNCIQQLKVRKPYHTTIPFHVSDKFYRTQYLTIENTRKVNPLTEDEHRIAAETKKLSTIFSSYSSENPFHDAFNAPAKGPISSQFGLKRIYNKQPRPPHTGLDIAAPADAPVQTIGNGTVVEAGDYFYTGNTVIIDHGMGVFSLYGHLKTMDVKRGEVIKQGMQIGTIGMTGRATGPHLHWSMIMNQTYVDPLLFVSAQKITVSPSHAAKKEAIPSKPTPY